MIPTIATIVEDLLAGTITKGQAIAWLNTHAEDAAYDLRDHFAGQAMNARMQLGGFDETIAAEAYQMADAMLAARIPAAQERSKEKK